MNKSDYFYVKAGDFYYPVIPRTAIPDETLYKWDEEKKKFVVVGVQLERRKLT